MKTRLSQLGLWCSVGVVLFALSCSDINHCQDHTPPAVPSGVYTITGDGYVEVCWSEVRTEDLAGYRIYCSGQEQGTYWRIGCSRDNYFVDQDVVNGVTYYYAVTSYDGNGNESDLSYETVHDTPRPEGQDLVIYDQDARAGVDFSGYYHHMIQPWDDPFVDMYLLWLNNRYCLASKDLEYQGAIYGTDIQYAGYVNSLDELDWAPEGGWSVDIADTVVLYQDHAYVVWTWDNHFAKFQVVHIGYDYVVIDWAFQVDEGNPELKALPTDENAESIILREPRDVGLGYKIPSSRSSRESEPDDKEQLP